LDQTNYGNYHAVVTPPLRYQLTDITGLLNENAAIDACACNTNSTLYESFEVWYSKSNSTWTCVSYSKLNYKPAQFQNPYSDVGQTYGYSETFVPLKTCTPTLNYELIYEKSHGSYAENLTNPGNSNPSPSTNTTSMVLSPIRTQIISTHASVTPKHCKRVPSTDTIRLICTSSALVGTSGSVLSFTALSRIPLLGPSLHLTSLPILVM
jgi:hypothetical protein